MGRKFVNYVKFTATGSATATLSIGQGDTALLEQFYTDDQLGVIYGNSTIPFVFLYVANFFARPLCFASLGSHPTTFRQLTFNAHLAGGRPRRRKTPQDAARTTVERIRSTFNTFPMQSVEKIDFSVNLTMTAHTHTDLRWPRMYRGRCGELCKRLSSAG